MPVGTINGLRDFVSVKDFGAKGDGLDISATANVAAFNTAYAAISLTGQTLYVPSGIYMINSRTGIKLNNTTKSIDVLCDPGTVIKATSTFKDIPGNPLVYFNMDLVNPPAEPIPFKWSGGTIDGTLTPIKVVASSNISLDCLSIGGSKHISKVELSNLKCILNEKRSYAIEGGKIVHKTRGDSCLFIAADDISIVNCIFQGATDAGIYLSGDSALQQTTGRRCYVSGCTFLECFGVGFVSKRKYNDHIIDGNFFENCGVGCAIGKSAGIGLSGTKTIFALGGRKAIVSNNMFKGLGQGIVIDVCDDSVITGNIIEDYGIDVTGGASDVSAIIINGSKRCIVSNNITTFSITAANPSGYHPHRGASAVSLSRSTPAEGIDPATSTFDSTHNLITNNNFMSPPYYKVIVTGVPIGTPVILNAVDEGEYCNYNNAINNIVKGFVRTPVYKFVGDNSGKNVNYY